MKKTTHYTNKGFTLIELIVSVALFTIVMMVAMGAVFSVVNANRKSQSLNVVVNNLNFAFESMIRDLRTGTDYKVSDCDGNNTTDCKKVTFKDRNGRLVWYFQEIDDDGNYVISKSYPDNPGLAQGAITDPEVRITNMSFSLKGAGPNNGQHLLRIHLQGETGNPINNTQSSFNIQTLIAPRALDSEDL